jgi:hypothetical protein
MPGTARIGCDRDDGVRRRDHDRLRGRERGKDLRRRLRRLDAAEPHLVDRWLLVAMDEVLLEFEPTVRGQDLGPHGHIGHRQDPRLDAHRGLELERDRGRTQAGAQPIGAPEVGRQVAVAETEPRQLSELLEPVHDGPALTAQPPPADVVVEVGQRVGDGVVIGPDRETVEFEVVAGVHDDGEVGSSVAGEPLGDLGTAHPACQQDDPHRLSSLPTSSMRSIVSRS